jgi:hypothetical protein
VLQEIVHELGEHDTIGVGVPGLISRQGVIRSSPNMSTAIELPVREQLSVGRIGSLLDALDASDRLYQARIRVTQALSEQMLAQAQLLKHMRQLASVTDYAKLTVQ